MSVRDKVPEYYRKKATFCRAIEKGVSSPEIAQALRELAGELEATAAHMEQKFRKPGARIGSDSLH